MRRTVSVILFLFFSISATSLFAASEIPWLEALLVKSGEKLKSRAIDARYRAENQRR